MNPTMEKLKCVNWSDYDTIVLGVKSDCTGIFSSVGGKAQSTGPEEGANSQAHWYSETITLPLPNNFLLNSTPHLNNGQWFKIDIKNHRVLPSAFPAYLLVYRLLRCHRCAAKSLSLILSISDQLLDLRWISLRVAPCSFCTISLVGCQRAQGIHQKLDPCFSRGRCLICSDDRALEKSWT